MFSPQINPNFRYFSLYWRVKIFLRCFFAFGLFDSFALSESSFLRWKDADALTRLIMFTICNCFRFWIVLWLHRFRFSSEIYNIASDRTNDCRSVEESILDSNELSKSDSTWSNEARKERVVRTICRRNYKQTQLDLTVLCIPLILTNNIDICQRCEMSNILLSYLVIILSCHTIITVLLIYVQL